MYKISVIIPCYNAMICLEQCITALAHQTVYPIHEVILVDDGSPDIRALRQFVREIRDQAGFPVKLLSRKKNRGFAFTCNEGAASAAGEYLLFLNFDTIPQAGWLSALVSFLEQNRDAGILGSRLLYPGINWIQHAGGAFDRRQRPLHIYKGQPAFLPFLNKNRKLQWVTGACLLIKKEDFHAVSGFDEIYITSSEDVDLCFKVRFQLEKPVYMVADSWLYHYSDITGATSRHIERTHTLLLERWKDRIVPDEEKIYREDGYSPELLELLESYGNYRKFGVADLLIKALDIATVDRQQAYVETRGIEGLKRDLERIGACKPGYNRLKFSSVMLSAPSPPRETTGLDKFVIQESIKRLSQENLSRPEKQALFRQLTDQLESGHFFLYLYNLASMLLVNGETQQAIHLFSFLAEFLRELDPALAGKASFKLAEASETGEEKKQYLRQCLALLPGHRRARLTLDQLD